MNNKSVLCITILLGLTGVTGYSQTFSDDFNDNSKDTAKWGTDIVPAGRFSEEGNSLVWWLDGNPSMVVTGSAQRPWILNQLPYDRDWTVQVVAEPSCPCNAVGEALANGLLVSSVSDPSDQIQITTYDTRTGPITRQYSTIADLISNGITSSHTVVPASPTLGSMLRLGFNSTTKVIQAQIATFTPAVPGSNLVFTTISSFGIAGSGGTTANAN